jgi:hypothetical protein
MHKTCIKIGRKIFTFLQAWGQEKKAQKDKLIVCLNYVNLKFLYIILSIFIFFKLFMFALVGYFCLNLLFIVNKCIFSYAFDQNCIFGEFLK